MMRIARNPNRGITCFTILWLLVFGYESLRLPYLSSLVTHPLPKVKFLFPPAGWIMFYKVDPYYGFADVYGLRGKTSTRLDPHEIFRTRAVGYDNIRRNVLISVLDPSSAPSFCRYLRWKFPDYDNFAIVEAGLPDVVKTPDRAFGRIVYTCSPSK